jgi:hypothetical protein
MGRFYNGDIEGKFWFALQSSDAADRFGVTGEEPNYITYYFDEDNLEDVEAEIKNIEETLGDKIATLDKFFEENNGYNDEMIEKIGITKDELRDYADLGLGKQIKDCIVKTSSCSFEAEL